MKKNYFLLMAVFLFGLLPQILAEERNPESLTGLLNRVGGEGSAEKFELIVDGQLSENGKDVFVITSDNGKPCIKGNSTLAVATGINWYLNHYVHVNYSWSNLKINLDDYALPVPMVQETRTSTADYRYYFNYCTFSYSMAFWTWDRWQQEIDWMALHGINMPLALVGADVVWKNVLTELGYTSAEINKFIAGPGFQAWWLMNNLEGWGGPNPDWWYVRQEKLSKDILSRMRSFGMEPILPGYSGMVPSNIKAKKGWNVADPGTWISFQRPAFLLPTDDNFVYMSDLYYKHLTALMGTSKYYSMDPFHEGGNTSGVDLPKAYKAIQAAMDRTNPEAKWVIQSWNENPRSECLTTIPKGKLIVLDLFSDGTPKWQSGYNGHDMVYCMLHNFGGRVGLHGRLSKTIDGYYDALSKFPQTMKGIGATPEGIETNPVLYDALFELPWRSTGSSGEWLETYAEARYGRQSDNMDLAWKELNASVYDCKTSQQGTTEPVICARPSLVVNSVSSWSTSSIYYDTQKVLKAVAYMLGSKNDFSSNTNYDYDLVDVTRQAITDYANGLLKQINKAYNAKNTAKFSALKDRYLQLILDQDSLLATRPEFMLGNWTQMARNVADEASGTTVSDRNWLETYARKQITVWGTKAAGSLHDYSNREWSGLLKDFHYERWKLFFDNLEKGKTNPNGDGWFDIENKWTEDFTRLYSNQPKGNSVDIAEGLFKRYFGSIQTDNNDKYYFAYSEEKDITKVATVTTYRGKDFTLGLSLSDGITDSLAVDYNNNGIYEDNEKVKGSTIHIPENAFVGQIKALLTLSDGTSLIFSVALRDEVTEDRTVAVRTADPVQGSVKIDGTESLSVTTKADVTLIAKPLAGYDFFSWTKANGEVVSRTNPFIYMGKDPINLTANFVINKWGVPQQDKKDMTDIRSYQQYLSILTVQQNDKDPVTIYSASDCPDTLFNVVPTVISAARGSGMTLAWRDTELKGLSFCCLSAYMDLNNDGDFDDEGEMLAARGAKESGSNTMVSNGSLQIMLPGDMPVGLTHIRLRFDGAWSGGWNSNGAKPAKATTQRMIYEILLDVTEHPSESPVISVKANDEKQGTVAISGLSNPAVVTPGDRIILQAQPSTGYLFEKWVDKYERIVGTEVNYSFVPVESGTFTAYFRRAMPDVITLGGGNFKYSLNDHDMTLIESVDNTSLSSLLLPSSYSFENEEYPIVSLVPGLLDNHASLSRLTIPASLVDLGSNVIFRTAWSGNGTPDNKITLDKPLKTDETWRLKAHVTTDGSSFNTWGSAIFATGPSSLADNYADGIQFYLAKSGSLSVKYGSEANKKTFDHTQGSSFFDVQIDKDSKDSVTISITNDKGIIESHGVANHPFKEITEFSSSIPKGVDIKSFVIYGDKGVSVLNRSAWKGAGEQDHLINLSKPLKANDVWSLKAHVTTDGSSFNQWGSAVLATGASSLANNYAGGIQFYLTKSGVLSAKYGSEAEKKTFNHTEGGASFDIQIDKDAKSNIVISVTNDKGVKESQTLAEHALNEINVFSSSIPVGINVDMVINGDVKQVAYEPIPLFDGCTSLRFLSVNISNPVFSAASNVLFNKQGSTLLRYSADRIGTVYEIPDGVNLIASNAFLNVKKLERIIFASGQNVAVEKNAFKGCPVYCQVAAEELESYRVWGQPLLLSVESANDVSMDVKADVVEINADDQNVGTISGKHEKKNVWLRRIFNVDQYYPVHFAIMVDSIVSDKGTVMNVSDVVSLYKFDGQKFVSVEALGKSIPAGSYLLRPVKAQLAKTLSFRMKAGDIAPASSSNIAFTGNASFTKQMPMGNVYVYEPSTDRFIRPVAGVPVAINPFEAYMTVEGTDLPDYIQGVSEPTSIESLRKDGIDVKVENGTITVVGTTDYELLDAQGRPAASGVRLVPGTYLLKIKNSNMKIDLK